MYVKPVFLDESGKRWRIVKLVLVAIAATFLFIPLLLLLSIARTPVMPEFQIQQQAHLAAPAAPRGNSARRHYQQSKSTYRSSLTGDAHAPPPME